MGTGIDMFPQQEAEVGPLEMGFVPLVGMGSRPEVSWRTEK